MDDFHIHPMEPRRWRLGVRVALKLGRSVSIAETNIDPKRFIGTADPRRAVAAVKPGRDALESLHTDGEQMT